MKKTILYAVCAVAAIVIAAFVVVGCGGDMGERSDNMDAFLEWFSGRPDARVVKYKITFDANGAKGTPPAVITVLKDSLIRLPNQGNLSKDDHKFLGWSADPSGMVGNIDGGDEYRPTSNVTLYARWELIEKVTSRVTVSSAGTGWSGGGSYVDGTTVTISAGTAPDGKQFTNWTSNPTVTFASPTSPTTTFRMPRTDVTVTANFGNVDAGKFAVEVSSVGTGASGGGSYEAGKTVTINAGGDPFAHRFQNWTVTSGGVGLANANSRTTTFIMPANAVMVTANFGEVPTYKVTVLSDGTNASKDSSYREGDEVTINAGTAPANQRFKGWTVTSGGVTLGNAESATTKFTMPANAVTVTANFGANTYTVTVSSVGTGASGGGEYSPGATVNINAGTIPSGYSIKWTSSNSDIIFGNANNATTTFTMPSAVVTVTALFLRLFTDSRDGNIYKTVTIGGKTWMAENLNYQTADSSWCYDNNPDSCAKYGRLYTWNVAKTACPTGWHLPSRREWGDLATAAGGTNSYGNYGDGGSAGIRLKAADGWEDENYGYGKGRDDYGFSAMPGGSRGSAGTFGGVGYLGYWWTVTEYNTGSSDAYYRYLYCNHANVDENYNAKSIGFSVRCVADD